MCANRASTPAFVLSLALAVAAGPAAATEGRIVANFDDWTLSDVGYSGVHDAGTYVVNIADWFTGGAPGSFIGFGGAFHLGSGGLSSALAAAGHSYVRSEQLEFSLAELQAYDGVFIGARPLGEDPGNLSALVAYVESGGCVYIYGGTDYYGSIAADAAILNSFSHPFGLDFASEMTVFRGTYDITGGHAIVTGVDELFCDNGTVVTVLDPGSPLNELVDAAFGGAIAVFDGEALVPAAELPGPAAFNLFAWPNPARDEIRLSFSHGGAKPAPVRIYSVSGCLVRELRCPGTASEQRTECVWDGRASNGERVAAGVYLARPVIEGARSVSLIVIR